MRVPNCVLTPEEKALVSRIDSLELSDLHL